MSKVTYINTRVGVEDTDVMKRDIETSLLAISENFDTLQNGVPNYWTLEEPSKPAPLSQYLVSNTKDYWVPEELDEGAIAAIFMWLTPPVPDTLLSLSNDDGTSTYPGKWVKVLEIS